MQKKWRIREGLYVELAIETRKLVEKYFSNIIFQWISREENEWADTLATKGGK